MKNLILTLIFLSFVFLTSCTKKPIYPTDQLPAHVPTGTSFGGVSHWGTFKLIGSQKQFDECWTGVPTYFTDTTVSSLRWGGSQVPIEDIVKNTTTWTFVAPSLGQSSGKFILNGDTSLYFIVQYTGQYSTIINDPQDPHKAIGTNISFTGVSVIGNGYTA